MKPRPGVLSATARRLKAARKDAKLSLRALWAKTQGIPSFQTIDNIERGRQRASLPQIEILAAALGVSAAWLAFGKEEDK